MKKKLLLLIIMVCMVVFTPNVSAKSNAVARYKNFPGSGTNYIRSGVIYAGEGDKNPSSATRGNFKLYNQYIEMNGKEYKAWCVDPALHSPRGADYTCTPLKDAGLEYIFNNLTGDETINAFAFRFYAIYAGIGMTIKDESGNEVTHSSLNYPKAAIIRYLQARNGDGGVTSEYGSDYNQFLSGNTAALDAAYNIATTAAQLKQASELEEATSGDGSGLKYTMTTHDKMSVTYVVTSAFAMKREEMEFTCENCASVDVLSWSEHSVTIKVNQLSSEGDGCKFTVLATFKKNGLYGCYGGEGNQFEVIVVDDPSSTPFPFEGHNPECGSECCTESPLDKPLDGIVANCCEETTHSYVKEYDLDDLFCYHNELQVPHYWEKCGADAYKTEEINEYCDLYCTERVTIDIPGAITAKSGRYFTLSKNPVGNTTSPYIQGFKRCRVRVKYDLWEKHYVDAVKNEVNKYNEFQLAAANYYFYVQGEPGGYLGSENVSGDATLTQNCEKYGKYCSRTVSCTVGTAGCGTDGTKSEDYDCWVADTPATGSYHFSYTKYKFKTSLPYHTSKYKEDPVTHKEIEVLPNGTKNASHDPFTVWDRDKQYQEAVQKANALTCPGRENGSPSVTGFDLSGKNENFDNQKSSLKGIMDGAENAYATAVSDAKTLEQLLTDCDTYFDTKSANEMYEFDPSMSFRYTQIYRNDRGQSELSVLPVNFMETPGCTISGPEKGDITYEGGMDTASPRYSGVYLTGFFNGKDFDGGKIEYDFNGSKFPSEKDPDPYKADKLFTHDARYKAVCEWEEDPNNVNTLVPNGAVTEDAVMNFTKHEYEYKVFLTTYDGSFETDWSVSNIGEKGKFDDFIIENGGTTCAGNPSSKNEMFSCTLHVEYEIVYTGKCNGTTTNPADCDPVNNVEGLFQFKVADPANIFPTGTTSDTGAPIARNWTDTSEGQTTKAEIEQRAARGLTYAQERESYKFHLTPEIMRHIKNYNVTKNQGNIGGYSDFNMTCDCPSQVQTNTLQGGGVGCTRCRSNLLTDLANNSISYEGQTYTVRAWSSRKSIDQVRNESHWR